MGVVFQNLPRGDVRPADRVDPLVAGSSGCRPQPKAPRLAKEHRIIDLGMV